MVERSWQEYIDAAAILVVIGWLLNQLSFWWKQRADRLRIRRKTLYYLLRIEWLFARLDNSQYVEEYLQIISELDPELSKNKDARTYLSNAIRQFLQDFILKDTAKNLKKLENRYVTNLNELAEVAPITAFRLEGQSTILQRLDSIQKYVSKVIKEESDLHMHDSTNAQQMLSEFAIDRLKDDIKFLRRQIYWIAIPIGVLTLLRLFYRFGKSRGMSPSEKEKMKQFLSQLQQTYKDQYERYV